MTGNNPKPGLVNVDVYTKFGKILSIHSQDIEWKPNIHGITDSPNHGFTERRKDKVNPVLPHFSKAGL